MSEEKKDLNTKSEAALREERILQFWRENKTFEKSLTKKAPKGHYVFYDGPPFATGRMHYGHILGSTVKDVIGRYKTMQGFYVPRKWGWDCHGLPIENIVEKELSVAGHKEIESLGIDKFVEHARSKVLEYDKDWEVGIERIGRWVDFKGSYKTMDNTFIESVWWALSELNKKDLIYEGVRVLAYCARCETPIANSEIAMDNSYKDIADISIFVKFELEDEPGTYLLAWTTTPWTLPGNTAIAINKNIKYVKIKVGNENFILAEDTLVKVLKDKEYSLVGEVSGESLIGEKYKPVFGYYTNSVANNSNIWKVWQADFVTTEKGTGIAHEAPAFGEDDMILAKQNDIPWIIHVDETGRFKQEVTDFAGLKVKPKDTVEDKDAHLRSDIEVIKYLQKTGSYFDKEKIMHSYPHCMRCDTPIIYYALPSWFINVTRVKGDIQREAKNINWVPAHLKEGRFKNIVDNAPDWNISRNRYWASPLPVWKCEACKNKIFVSSLDDLKNKSKKSSNKYFVMRHGESENNVNNIYSYDRNKNHLTEKGKLQAKNSANEIKGKKITKIFCSPFLRTRETAEIVAKEIGFPVQDIVYDDRIEELNFGEFSDKPKEGYWGFVKSPDWKFDLKVPNGESIQDAKNRVGSFLYDIDQKYKNENILVISHGIVVEMFPPAVDAMSQKESEEYYHSTAAKVEPGSVHEQKEFVSLPHNKNYELDLHRPYIDDIKLICSCGGNAVRIPEVLDCWFESGSMPFAQDHFPFENKDWQKNNFPAGFIAEYIAQTRTWFYYTHAVSTMLFGKAAFKNVVTTGTLRAEDGEKMSKSKMNYPDPWIFIDKYGVDPLRLYLMSSNLMKGEDANFSEKAVQDIASKVIGRLFNVLAFYELYRDKSLEKEHVPKSSEVLDQWIMERFYQTLEESTKGMETYDVVEATRPIEPFVDDLSTWYLRRSRERIKDGDANAKATLYFILRNISKVLASFAPFSSEEIWQRLKNENDVESVHLESIPTKPFKLFSFGKAKLLGNMQVARNIVSFGLEARQKLKIPVKQPLTSLKYKLESRPLAKEYIELIKDELNVKEVIFDKDIASEVELNTNITPALKAEGEYREFMRELQERRKTLGLNPSDKMAMSITDIYKKYKIPPSLQEHMLRVAAVAYKICDNFTENVDKEKIVTACLLHDMGNIIKFKMDVFPKMFEPEGVEYWQGVKDEYVKKYGNDEHEATLQIMKELGMTDSTVAISSQNRFSLLCKHAEGDDMEVKIVHYADGRVDPHGVVSYLSRMGEARVRYDHLNKGKEAERERMVACGAEIEKQIFVKCKIKPEDITDASVAPIIEELRGFVIK